jgi:ABC-type polysaccharide/polyol phosphate transport system ATPase subunit
MGERPNAIEVRDLHKSFRIPGATVGPARLGGLVRPRTARRELRLFEGISFDVGQGEFFGICGRNGSGKSTLMKLIASIYHPDRGTIKVAGRLAPFVELGVGFNPELSAHDNVVINGVMIGLTPRQARARRQRVMEFAELEQFGDMKLKNYSTGMRVRLAFAVMVEADPDVLLIDEVLAVGDAAFQEKSADVFRKLRARGKTIVLVTHSMPDIEEYCHRAMLLDDGQVERIGAPEEVAGRYMELNLEARRPGGVPGVEDEGEDAEERIKASITELAFIGPDGRKRTSVGAGEALEIVAAVKVERKIVRPTLKVELRNERGARIFAPPPIELTDTADGEFGPNERLNVRATIENKLAPGRYVLSCALARTGRKGGEIPVSQATTLGFTIAGQERRGGGIVALDHSVRVERQGAKPLVRT